jgi:quercetin dioxygenase-like cupin family protein
MHRTSLEEMDGITINELLNERTIKILASRNSAIARDQFTAGVSIIGPGKIHEEHLHEGNQELILVIGGQGEAKISGQTFDIRFGSVIGLERGEPHGFVNTGETDLMLFWIYDPPGEEEKFCKIASK